MQDYSNMDSTINQFFETATTTFPQPTRPINSYSLEPQELPETSYAVNPENMNFQSWNREETSLGQPEIYSQPKATAVSGGTKEIIEELEELLRHILELYAKLPPSARRLVNLEKFHVPRDLLQDLNMDSVSTSRGVQGAGDLEELSHKLERFKIKTIQLGGGVVKEDDRETGYR
uniref:Uncharacterized protein n=1 Tax=Bruguiera gymnorhiza TaxID=39984 RepID=B1Q4U4_BRUGY|nr:hypothetical protein [Bruguiera gymnorhiza]